MEVHEGALEAERNQKFFLENEKELRLKYPDEFIAIADQEVIANEPTHEELMEAVEKTSYELPEVLVKLVRTGHKVVR